MYKDEFRRAEIYFDGRTSRVCFATSPKGTETVRYHTPIAESIALRIQASKYEYNFSYSLGGDYQSIGKVEKANMTAHDSTGTLFGIFVSTHDGSELAEPVLFREFIIN